MHNLYWSVYKNLENEIIDLSYKIHFSDDQLNVYSIKIAELLLRCCVEIESISKDLYLSDGGTIKKNEYGRAEDLYFDTDCLDYLESKWFLSEKVVYTSSLNFYFTKDENKILTPLKKGNERGTSGSKWKQAYQAVKHNRSKNLNQATVKNITHAMAALYLLNIYYKDEKPKYIGGYVNVDNFDKTIGSSLFSVNIKNPSYIPSWKIMHGDKCSVYIEKFLDNDYGQLAGSIIKQEYDLLNNSNDKKINPLQLIDILKSKEVSSLFKNSCFEIVLNKNQEIYPIRNWAHPITGLPYGISN